MQEKILKAQQGMPVLIGSIVLYLLALALTILGGVWLENGRTIGILALVVGIVCLTIGFIPFLG